jgi:hypothetical protein
MCTSHYSLQFQSEIPAISQFDLTGLRVVDKHSYTSCLCCLSILACGAGQYQTRLISCHRNGEFFNVIRHFYAENKEYEVLIGHVHCCEEIYVFRGPLNSAKEYCTRSYDVERELWILCLRSLCRNLIWASIQREYQLDIYVSWNIWCKVHCAV